MPKMDTYLFPEMNAEKAEADRLRDYVFFRCPYYTCSCESGQDEDLCTREEPYYSGEEEISLGCYFKGEDYRECNNFEEPED